MSLEKYSYKLAKNNPKNSFHSNKVEIYSIVIKWYSDFERQKSQWNSLMLQKKPQKISDVNVNNIGISNLVKGKN